ncbi:MAG: twin-arginine translocase subunit TatC [Verrucomicrobiia bacterium Tous-C4TDCM]|nr:MAG: twin-arginine translocase subunit TatC [Verrucomicrobiae bacterium Tous-C4TDCM]
MVILAGTTGKIPHPPPRCARKPAQSSLATRPDQPLNPPRPEMFLLKKVFQLRDKANPENEKPFLDHLEDLRVMVTRIVITLLISMIVCFAFRDELMEIIRKPVDEVMKVHQASLLPKEISSEKWEAAKNIERAAVALEPALAENLLARFDAETLRLVNIVRLLRAVAVLPEDQRAGFLTAAGTDDPTAKDVSYMLEKGANPDIDSRGNLQIMSVLNPTEPFMLSMKLAFFAGIVVSFPLLLMFILQFVLPGLHQHERGVLWPALAIGFGLFLLGVCFAYFVVLPRALVFFFEWGLQMGVSNDWRIGLYVTFATQFTLLFGLSFELPVVVMVFVKLGLLTYESMSRTRPHAILAIVVIAAIITPTPDAFTLVLMAGPMVVLYEICIWLAYFDHRKTRRAEEAEERERMERLLLAPDEPEGGEEEGRSDHDGHHAPYDHHDHPDHHDPGAHEDHWDPSDDEKAWQEGGIEHDDTPPESIPDEEKRRMSDLASYPESEPAEDVKPEETVDPANPDEPRNHDETNDGSSRP